MPPLPAGASAPPVPGVDVAADPTALFFYKVTCPVCQLAAPKVQSFESAYPGRIVGIGQDAPEKLHDFARHYGLTFGSNTDTPPYPVSDAYGIRVVPTTFLVAHGTIEAVAESWDRDGLNDLSARLARLIGVEPVPISVAGDGLPPFRPG